MCTPAQFDCNIIRILLFRNDATELLVESTANGLRLPAVPIAAHTRAAQQITARTKSSWNLETYCVFCLPDGGSSHAPVHYQVAEICRHAKEPPSGMRWLPAASLSVGAFEDPEDFAAIENSLTTLEKNRQEELPGAFGRPGWLGRVTEWVKEQAAGAGLSLTGEFCQFNAGLAFSLLRFQTDGPALWFKAVGEPNLREFPITRALARLLPSYIPPIVATRPDWNAWLTTEVAGKHPDADCGDETWVAAAEHLADLQIASHGKTLHLIDAGCHDTRIRVLAEKIDPYLEIAAELMEQQTKTSRARLSASELLALARRLRRIFSRLAQSDLTNALGHLDLHPGNILVADGNCVFLDWAEASVGHPFVAFEYLLEHLRKLRAAGEAREAQLAVAYTKNWRRIADAASIEEAMSAAPLVAVFTCVVTGNTWRDEAYRSRPEIAALLRSLTRRMKREADALEQQSVSCVP